MKISKYGHACLLIEEGEARLLIDPGAYSKGFEDLTDLDAVLITHQHPDHLVADNLVALLKANSETQVYVDEGSAAVLEQDGRVAHQVVHDGDVFEVAGVPVAVEGKLHAEIHARVPRIPDVGYRIGQRFFYAGDNFTVPVEPVEVLAFALGAPWLKVGEVLDYILAVKPKVAIPVHDAVLAIPEMHIGFLESQLNPEDTKLRVIANGTSTQV